MGLTRFWSLVWPLEELQFLAWEVLVFTFFPLLSILVSLHLHGCRGNRKCWWLIQDGENQDSLKDGFKVQITHCLSCLCSLRWSSCRVVMCAAVRCVAMPCRTALCAGPTYPSAYASTTTRPSSLTTVTFSYLCMTMKLLLCRVEKLLVGF